MNVSEAIQTKRAVREFQQKPLPDEVMRAILNAGRRAQSAKNMQAWRFLAITERQTLQALSALGTYAGHLAKAALGVAILTPSPDTRWSIMFDAGQSAAYMQLAGWELGVGSCPATIYEPEKARALLGFPADLFLNVMLSFGYPADPETITRPPKKGGRESADTLIHWNHW